MSQIGSNIASRVIMPMVNKFASTKLGSKSVTALCRAYEGFLTNPGSKQTIWRGVPSNHYQFELAKRGIVIPRQLFLGNDSSQLHNYGTQSSSLSSWSRLEAIAVIHASLDGVLLKAEIPGSRIVWSPDEYCEGEVCVKGIVAGAKVMFVEDGRVVQQNTTS